MGRKMKLIPFLFKPMEPPYSSSSSSSSWRPWPACGNPRTFSFRAERTMNPVFVTEDESRLTDSPESAGLTVVSVNATELEEEPSSGESIENVIRELKMKSDRLFFEPGETTSSILGAELQQEAAVETNTSNGVLDIPTKEDGFVVMEMDSKDPFVDFKKSMEEMVDAHGLLNYSKDWDWLEELLDWYLKVNAKCNHGYIVGAFVELLFTLHYPNSSSSPSASIFASCDDTSVISQSPISALSFPSSTSTSTTIPCLSSLEEGDEAQADHKGKSSLEGDHRVSSGSNV